jgi:DNA end-binding protein Ku
VSSDDIVKGFKVDTDTYVAVDKEELDNIALDRTRIIDVDEFVPKSEIDELYLVRRTTSCPRARSASARA